MRYLGWILGGLFLTDGLVSLLGKKDLVERFSSAASKVLPQPVARKLNKATDVNDTALTMMGINNLIAGAGMMMVATLTGMGHAKKKRRFWA